MLVPVVLLVVAVISLLLAAIEVMKEGQVDFRDCFQLPFFAYGFMLALGNVFTSLLGRYVLARMSGNDPALAQWIPDEKTAWILAGFLGLFGFQMLIRNINVTVSGMDLLALEAWIQKARDNAVTRAQDLHTQIEHRQAVALAQDLRKIPRTDMNAYLAQHFGPEFIGKLAESSQTADADEDLAKALALVYQEPEVARAIRKRGATVGEAGGARPPHGSRASGPVDADLDGFT